MTTKEHIYAFFRKLEPLGRISREHRLELLCEKLAYQIGKPDIVRQICDDAYPLDDRIADSMVSGIKRRNEDRVSWEGVR